MGEQVFRSIGAAVAAINRDLKKLGARIHVAQRKAARNTRNYIVREKVPRAFGELADSASVVDTASGADVIFDAPHAAAVEVGSRPHMPPLEPLIAWVTLRGIQGLTAGGKVKRVKAGPAAWRARAAESVATALHEKMGSKAAKSWRAHAQNAVRALTPSTLGKLDADPAVVSVARAIQMKIARKGTKPFRYVGTSVHQAVAELDRFVRAALKG
jgi:hypothetical protein